MNVSAMNLIEQGLEQIPVQPVYKTPTLRCLGDIREMTLGGSLGTGDSGSAGTQEF